MNKEYYVADSEGYLSRTLYLRDEELPFYTDLLTEKPPERPSSPWQFVILEADSSEELLQLEKSKKNKLIDEQRETQNNLPILYSGILFDADEVAKRNINGWLNNINSGQTVPENFTWRDYNDVNQPANAEFIIGLSAAITVRTTEIFQKSWDKKAEVNILTTVHDINDYDVTTGW